MGGRVTRPVCPFDKSVFTLKIFVQIYLFNKV